ncbi:hypothetical protein K502DRAFT_347621 [Neoconidiobolus thromboides FSU 785]|nr:hypothetical protein K502DRAFT_347621 [Neoconidiobolus thromboides FSU 785]
MSFACFNYTNNIFAVDANKDNYLLEGLSFNQEASKWIKSEPKEHFPTPLLSSSDSLSDLDIDTFTFDGSSHLRLDGYNDDLKKESNQINAEAKLIVEFKRRVSPYLSVHIEDSAIYKIYSSHPSLSETFLFFAICASASIIGNNYGPKSEISINYYSKALELMESIPKKSRDESYFNGIFVMQYLGEYLLRTL